MKLIIIAELKEDTRFCDGPIERIIKINNKISVEPKLYSQSDTEATCFELHNYFTVRPFVQDNYILLHILALCLV